jgi:hypothetical protein
MAATKRDQDEMSEANLQAALKESQFGFNSVPDENL